MNILILGAGAIGCFLGETLAAQGQRVMLVGRSALMKNIAQYGLTLRHPRRPAQTTKPLTATDLNQLSTPFDYILLTVKNPSVVTAIEQLAASSLNLAQTYIVSFQNGLGSEDQLVAAFGAARVIAGTVTVPIQAVESTAGYTIEISKAKGGIGLAPLRPEQIVKPLANVFNQAGWPTMIYEDYRAMKWSKLLLNIINNATSAILNQPPAEIITHNDLFDLEIEALQETTAVMKAQHLSFVKLPGYPTDWLGYLLMAPLPRLLKRAILRPFMASGRGSKMPSLQIDLANGRAVSEISALNGAIVQVGQRLGIATPVNQALTEIVTGLFDGRLTWSDYQRQPERLVSLIKDSKTGFVKSTTA